MTDSSEEQNYNGLLIGYTPIDGDSDSTRSLDGHDDLDGIPHNSWRWRFLEGVGVVYVWGVDRDEIRTSAQLKAKMIRYIEEETERKVRNVVPMDLNSVAHKMTHEALRPNPNETRLQEYFGKPYSD